MNRFPRYQVTDPSALDVLLTGVYNFGVKTKPSSKAFACILNALDALDNDCVVSPNDMATFLERILFAFGLRHDDKQIKMLKKELKELLCHNTDLTKFVGLVRQSNKAEYEDSPKTTATSIKTYEYSILTNL